MVYFNPEINIFPMGPCGASRVYGNKRHCPGRGEGLLSKRPGWQCTGMHRREMTSVLADLPLTRDGGDHRARTKAHALLVRPRFHFDASFRWECSSIRWGYPWTAHLSSSSLDIWKCDITWSRARPAGWSWAPRHVRLDARALSHVVGNSILPGLG